MAIDNRHDFHAFSTLCGSDLCPAAFHLNEARVNEAFFFIECTSVVKFVGDIRQHSTQTFIAATSLKAPMRRQFGAIPSPGNPRLRRTANRPELAAHRRFQTWCRDEVLRR